MKKKITPEGQRRAMLKAYRALTGHGGEDLRQRMSEGAQQVNASGKGFRKGHTGFKRRKRT